MTKSQLFSILVAGGAVLGIIALIAYIITQNNASSLAKRTKEIDADNYSLEEAIHWFNDNRSDNIHSACILKEKAKPETGDHKIKLQHCFLNASKEPLLGINDPVLIVRANSLDEHLEAIFGDKTMVVLE